MSGLDALRQTFFLECSELLEALDDGFDILADADPDAGIDIEVVNAVFRSVHSIKGGAASFALDTLVHFAHGFETALDEMRAGRFVPQQSDWVVLRRAGDHLTDLVSAAREGREVDEGRSHDILAEIDKITGGAGRELERVMPPAMPSRETLATPQPNAFAPMTLDFELGGLNETRFEIGFRPRHALFENGHDPVHLFRELETLGDMSVSVDISGLPGLTELDAHAPYLAWTLTLRGKAQRAEIEDIFEFVAHLAELSIKELDDDGLVPAASPAPAEQAPQDGSGSKEPDLHVNPTSSSPEPRIAKSVSPSKATVRVDLDLVDDLINVVGELVINQSFLSQSISDAGLAHETQITAGLDEFKTLAGQIQEGVMSIRAQPVKPLFQRMARIVREAAAVSGKIVRFETCGETTEVDTTVIERLIDPLTHILRNAVDHGLEPTAVRLGAGKPAEGIVRLSAEHRSGRVLIEISDDGAGINRPKVLQIAKAKGLVPDDAQPAASDIDRLLFLPGFSTAEQVTDLSGRGVGMDVVRSAIQKLGGRINIQSVPGKGTTFSISLPLTLAVLEGMIVSVAGHTMVVPITAIIETLKPVGVEIESVSPGCDVVRVREELIPIVDVGRVLGYRSPHEKRAEHVLLLIETEQEKRWALAVDEIRDQRQVVIKSLEQNYGRVIGIAAATILGDGKIALIVDPEDIVRSAADTILPGASNAAGTARPIHHLLGV